MNITYLCHLERTEQCVVMVEKLDVIYWTQDL